MKAYAQNSSILSSARSVAGRSNAQFNFNHKNNAKNNHRIREIIGSPYNDSEAVQDEKPELGEYVNGMELATDLSSLSNVQKQSNVSLIPVIQRKSQSLEDENQNFLPGNMGNNLNPALLNDNKQPGDTENRHNHSITSNSIESDRNSIKISKTDNKIQRSLSDDIIAGISSNLSADEIADYLLSQVDISPYPLLQDLLQYRQLFSAPGTVELPVSVIPILQNMMDLAQQLLPDWVPVVPPKIPDQPVNQFAMITLDKGLLLLVVIIIIILVALIIIGYIFYRIWDFIQKLLDGLSKTSDSDESDDEIPKPDTGKGDSGDTAEPDPCEEGAGEKPPNAKSCPPPSGCPESFCQPYDNLACAEQIRNNSKELLLMGIGEKVHADVVPIWEVHIKGGSATRQDYSSLKNHFVASPTTEDATNYLLDNLDDSLYDDPPRVDQDRLTSDDVEDRIGDVYQDLEDSASGQDMNFDDKKLCRGT